MVRCLKNFDRLIISFQYKLIQTLYKPEKKLNHMVRCLKNFDRIIILLSIETYTNFLLTKEETLPYGSAFDDFTFSSRVTRAVAEQAGVRECSS